MTGYVKMVGDFVRSHFVRNDAGQNMVETALIIGTISLVIVAAFTMSDVTAAIGNLANQVVCQVQGGSWSPGQPGSCA
jgi:Flp pilus assembly pilin Flp